MGQRNGRFQAPSSAWITVDRRQAIYNRDEWLCAYCQTDLRDVGAQDRTLDHIVTLAQYAAMPNFCGDHTHRGTALAPCCQVWFGSKHKSTNVITACDNCNKARKETDWQTFASRYAGAYERIVTVVNDARPLDIRTAKLQVAARKLARGEKYTLRSDYANCWRNAQRLSQGIDTVS